MKKNIFKTLAAALCIGAFVLTGCTNNFEGTTPDFKQKKEAQTGNYGEGNNAKGLSTYSFSFSPSSINTAAEDTEIEVSFTSQFELDLDSVENAFTFYKLKENSKTKRYYPEHDGVITKTLLHVTEPDSYSGTVSFLYRLNTKDVTTDMIAFVVDGTKLKYKNGIAAMSNDGNLKAGEETDSIIRYIDVSNKNDGTSTDPISNSYSESWTANNYNVTSLSYYGELETSETDTTPSGKLRFYTYAPSKTLDADGVTSAYDDGLADVLAKKFKLQIQKPGSTKWEAGAVLTFAYHSSYQYKDYDYYSSNSYTTDVDTKAFDQGTKWRIVCDKSVALGKPSDWVKDAYGHAPFEYYPKVTTKVYPSSWNSDYVEIPYGDKDTTFIYAWGNSGADPKPTFTKDDCDYMSAFFTQCDFVNWINTNENNIEVNIKTWQVELDKTDGFILVDSKKTIVPSTTTVHKNADGIIDKVIITPNNDKLNLWRDSYDVYVGSGTTIKENPDYPKQVQFGCYPDLSKGPLSGYVLLAQNVIKAGTAYTTAEDWRGQTYSAWINEGNYGRSNSNNNWENHFNGDQKVYLIAGETYHIQFVNGYNSYRDVFLSAAQASGWSPDLCYYGQLYLIDADEDTWSTQNYARVINYNDSGNVEYTPSKTGYYYICTNRDATASLLNTHANNHYDPITGDGYDWYYDAYCDLDGNDIYNTSTSSVPNPTYDPDNPDTTGPANINVYLPALFDYATTAEGKIILDTNNSDYAQINYNNHKMENGYPLLNPDCCIPYHWGNVYYHIYMD